MKRRFDLIFEKTMKLLTENDELTEDLAEESNEAEAQEAQGNEEQEQIDEGFWRGMKQNLRFSLNKDSQYQKDFADYTKDMNIAMKNSGFETLPDKPYIWKRKIGKITIYVQFVNPMAKLVVCKKKKIKFNEKMLKLKVYTKDMKAKGEIPSQNIFVIGTATTEDEIVKKVIKGAINCGLDEDDAKKYIMNNRDSVESDEEDFEDNDEDTADEAPKKKKKAPAEEPEDDAEAESPEEKTE